MRNINHSKRILAVLLLTIWLWIVGIPSPSVLATEIIQSSTQVQYDSSEEDNWVEVNQSLVDALAQTYVSTEELATRELDRWSEQRLEEIEHPFLDWYFNFLHQKATEFGVPFAWIAFKADSHFKVLQTEEERQENLSTDQIIRRRMEAEIYHKFAEMVMNEDAMTELKDIIERIAQNYASSARMSFALVKNQYRIADQEWEEHLSSLSDRLSAAGVRSFGIDPSELTGDLATKVLTVMATATSTKVVASLVAKSTSKFLVKGGATVAAKWGAALLDPALGIGLIGWDIWDYEATVAKDRPRLKETLTSCVVALRNSIQEDGENGIMDVISVIHFDIMRGLQPVYG
jgi:hypothetical protein